MTRRSLLRISILLCCVLGPTVAAHGDPVSGTWTGEVVPDSGRRMAVMFQLKFDGKTGVTGTASGFPGRVDIKAGTLQAKTGALRLDLGQVGDPKVLMTLDGTIVKDAWTGRAIDGSGEGTFKMARKH